MKLDEQSLIDYLRAEAESAGVGPAPVEEIHRAALRRRRGRRAAAIAGAAAAVVTVTVAGMMLAGTTSGPGPITPPQPGRTVTATPNPPRFNPDELETLDTCPETASEYYTSKRDLDIAWVQRDCTTVLATSGGADDSQPALSHDGERAAFVRYPGQGIAEIVIVERATNRTRTVLSRAATMSGLSWSPDDQTLAFSMEEGTGHPSVYLLDLATTTITPSVSSPTADLSTSWSPDGQRLAWIRADAHGSILKIWERGSPSVIDLPGAPRYLHHPAWLDPSTILVAKRNQVLAIDTTGRVTNQSPRLGAGQVISLGTQHGRILVAFLTDHVNEVRLVQLDAALNPVAQRRVSIGVMPSL